MSDNAAFPPQVDSQIKFLSCVSCISWLSSIERFGRGDHETHEIHESCKIKVIHRLVIWPLTLDSECRLSTLPDVSVLLGVFFFASRNDFLGVEVQLPCKSVNAFSNGVRISIANYKQHQINNTPRRADFPLRLCESSFFGRSRRLADLRLGLLINFGSELIKDMIFRVINGLEE